MMEEWAERPGPFGARDALPRRRRRIDTPKPLGSDARPRPIPRPG